MEGGDEEEGSPSRILTYKNFLAREKALHQNLNMTNKSNTSFVGYFWAPLAEEATIKDKIEDVNG